MKKSKLLLTILITTAMATMAGCQNPAAGNNTFEGKTTSSEKEVAASENDISTDETETPEEQHNEYRWIIEPEYGYNDVKILGDYYVTPESEAFEYLFYVPYGEAKLIERRELAIDPMYDKYDYYDGLSLTGLYVTEQNGKQGLIFQDGEIILTPEYDLIYNLYYLAASKGGYSFAFTNTLSLLDEYTPMAPAWWINNFYGINTGKVYLSDFGGMTESNFIGVVISAEIDTTSLYGQGSYSKWSINVPGGGKYGLANNGKLVVPCEYDGFLSDFLDRLSGIPIRTVEDNRIVFFKDKKIYVFDQDGNCYSNGIYDKVDNGNQELYFLNGYLTVCRNGMWGLIDVNGNEVVGCQFEDISAVYDGKAWAKQNGKWGVIQIIQS